MGARERVAQERYAILLKPGVRVPRDWQRRDVGGGTKSHLLHLDGWFGLFGGQKVFMQEASRWEIQ